MTTEESAENSAARHLRIEGRNIAEAETLLLQTSQTSLAPALESFGFASADEATREFASRAAQEDGSLCFGQTPGGCDAHFCARLVREAMS